MAVVERATIPPSARPALARMHRERLALERVHVAELRRGVVALTEAIRAVVVGEGQWTLSRHARAMTELRRIGRRWGSGLSVAARNAAIAAAAQGIDHTRRRITTLASAATAMRVGVPAVDVAAADRDTIVHIDARTHDVGARAGEVVGQIATAKSYLESKAETPRPAALVAGSIVAIVALRAENEAKRVIVTEMTAGQGFGAAAALMQFEARAPGRMKKYWDATLDLRVCADCAEAHHSVVEADEPFPFVDVEEEPAHPNCRCCTGPWTDDWSALVGDLGIAPGPRTGVQEQAEHRLPSFSAQTPQWLVDRQEALVGRLAGHGR